MSVREEMNITRALTELKRITKNIEETVQQPNKYVAITIGQGNNKRLLNTAFPLARAEELIKGNMQVLDTLFARRSAIKRAVVLSNASTLVKFGGKDITVAEAIEIRATVPARKNLLNDMVNEYNKFSATVSAENTKLQARIDTQVADATKNITATEGVNVADTLDSIRKSISENQLKLNEVGLLDPCDIAKRIEALRAEVREVDSELDFLLNESNAVTKITIEYDN